ncbi:MAG: 16S rRNA (uracil(1498)-N(3))-methyltransferase [Ruminococcaceae bacterium]|nr:16S rRNA (uracil(1498)-N(3))-methyltransferase [Oscillospiraceae bacterium]
MRRFFTEPMNIGDGKIRIIEDASHITKVLRMSEGDEIIVFDGTGKEYRARLDLISPKECLATVVSEEYSSTEPKIRVSVFQGIPKAGKMETIIQKVVELGAYEIIPVEMERCVVKLDGKARIEKTKRWNKVSVEAAKQCGRSVIPKVLEPVSYDKSLEMMSELDLTIMPYEVLGHNGEKGLKSILKNFSGETVGIVIGPEGGFSDKEAEKAKDKGINQVGLGERILRTETVASAVVPIIMYEKDEI